MTLKRDCIPYTLSNGFYHFGRYVARHPWPFVFGPIIASVLLVIGMARVEPTSDLEYLYVPIHAPSKLERDVVEARFLYSEEEHYTSLRRTRLGGVFRVVVVEKQRKNMFTDEHIAALRDLDLFIKNVTARHNRRNVTYDEVCVRWLGECADSENSFLLHMSDKQVADVDLKFPVHVDEWEGIFLILAMQLGGVELDEDGHIRYFEAAGLTYNVQHMNESVRDFAAAWTREVTDALLEYESPLFEVNTESFETIERELEGAVFEVVPLFTITFSILGLFAFLSLLMRDWTKGKPFIASAGMIAATLGAASGLGLLVFCGAPFTTAVGAVPFLIVGECKSP